MTVMLVHTLATAASLALACALLSVVVILRRWALLGEGISHSGFGGAGTAWLLMLLIPALDQPWMPYISLAIFSVLTAIAIGAISREGRGVNSDAAIGIFLVASLAWGILAQHIYTFHRHAMPFLFENLLFGELGAISPRFALAAIALSVAVILIVVALRKEILAYGFDPLLAATSGVPSGFIHYLLIVLIALVIIVGARIAGSVLVTALLVLPGATALLVSRKLNVVLGISIVVALVGTIGGVLLGRSSPNAYIPVGPMIVLLMFVQFLGAYTVSRANRGRETAE